MKYRHAFHAGNFADVHKHVALLALLRALARKDKGFLFVDTHAGRGRYPLGDEARAGIVAVLPTLHNGPDELADYAGLIDTWRATTHEPKAYPGSTLIAAQVLRAQDRGVAVELQPGEFEALRRQLGRDTRVRPQHGDGYAVLRALLPPIERRGLVLCDPPYEDRQADQRGAAVALRDALERFETGVFAIWYPIKEQRETDRWVAETARGLGREVTVAELWIHPRDSRAGLNGSGLFVVNPPFQFAERCGAWQAALVTALGAAHGGQRAFAP